MSRKGQNARPLDENSILDDDLDESLYEPVSRPYPARGEGSHSRNVSTKSASYQTSTTQSASELHSESLQRELASVRKVNEAIEGVLESLEKAKSNMKSVNQTVGAASSLLNIWTRILSQTEHNQRLILDPSWQGASQDIADIEEETTARQQALERREAEEQERRALAAKKAEEEERRRVETAGLKPKPSVRGRTGASSRGSTAGRAGSTSTNTAGASRGAASSRRTTSGTGIGRGGIGAAGSTRGRT